MPRLMQVLEYLDPSGDTMIMRVPENEPAEIKWGAQLTVRESQEAVFFRDGKALDVFGPGRHVLKTKNIPIIAKNAIMEGTADKGFSELKLRKLRIGRKINTNMPALYMNLILASS